MIRFFIGLLFLAHIVCLANAQGKLEVTGDFRARSEYRHGFGTLAARGQHSAFFVDQRSRLITHYTGLKYTVRLSLQDVRVWGSQSQLVREDGSLTAMHEAWGEVFFAKAFSARVGRQEIVLDDHRIFGNVDWAMQARSHDALLLKFAKKCLEAQAGFAFNQDKPQLSTTYYTTSNSYKSLQYLWLRRNADSFSTSVLMLNNGRQGGTATDYHTYYTQTFGLRSSFEKGRLKSAVAYYHQIGSEPDDSTSVNAFYVNADLRYQVDNSFNVVAGYEFLSGNDNPPIAGNRNRAFNPFYGTNHKFNGTMDYFYVGNHINSIGLRDLYLYLNYQVRKISSGLQFHYFESDGAIADPADGSILRNALGTECDFVLQYQFSDEVRFDAGYSQFFPTSTLEALRDIDSGGHNNWAWLMVTIKPVFYKTPEAPKNP